MNRFLRVAARILTPPVWLTVMLIPVSAAALAASFILLGTDSPISVASYVISAYTLTALCVRIPSLVRAIKRIGDENAHLSRLTRDPHLRIKLSLSGALAFNLIYAALQLFLGIHNRSPWFYSLFAYYVLLGVMRLLLLVHTTRHTVGEEMRRELHLYRACGIALVAMNAALIAIIAYVTAQSHAVTHNEIITIALAAYTFTSISVTVVNVIKYRQYKSPVWSASKVLSFVAAIVSVQILEDAMFASFGTSDDGGLRLKTCALSGAAITAFVLLIGIHMTLKATRALKQPISNGNEQTTERQ